MTGPEFFIYLFAAIGIAAIIGSIIVRAADRNPAGSASDKRRRFLSWWLSRGMR